ncbi:MAG: MBL fold metallo-hydrolase, partial [Sorangium cellulosum]
MDYPSFPIHLTEMGAHMDFHDLQEGQVVTIQAGAEAINIANARGNHPNGVFAYRIDFRGKAMVYCTDTEHYADVDPKIVQLAQDADVFIYDTMYLPEEYSGKVGGSAKIGWGHSTYEEGAKIATAAKVKQLVLFHHDPVHTDAMVADKERRAQKIFSNSVAAREGLVIHL